MSLEAACERVLQLRLSSFQLKLDIIDVLANIRPVARIIVRKRDEAADCARVLLQENLEISVGASCQMIPGNLGFVDHQTAVGASDRSDFVRLYVSKQRSKCDSAKKADELAMDLDLGRELGYPICCVKAVERSGSVPSILDSLARYSEGGLYDPLAWPAAHLFDGGLIAHFPCSMRCQQTHLLAQKRLKTLDAIDSRFQTRFWYRFVELNTMPYPADAAAYPWEPGADMASYTPLLPVHRHELYR
jgi:hypothetical protein